MAGGLQQFGAIRFIVLPDHLQTDGSRRRRIQPADGGDVNQVPQPGVRILETMQDRGVRDDYIVLVGGAPLNEEFGKAVGADAYCRDAAIAVETAVSLVGERRNRAA